MSEKKEETDSDDRPIQKFEAAQQSDVTYKDTEIFVIPLENESTMIIYKENSGCAGRGERSGFGKLRWLETNISVLCNWTKNNPSEDSRIKIEYTQSEVYYGYISRIEKDSPILEFEDFLKSGIGEFNSPHIKYFGFWNKNQRNGWGIHIDRKNRVQYFGMFRNNEFHGRGILRDLNRFIHMEGNFRQGLPVGKGFLYFIRNVPKYLCDQPVPNSARGLFPSQRDLKLFRDVCIEGDFQGSFSDVKVCKMHWKGFLAPEMITESTIPDTTVSPKSPKKRAPDAPSLRYNHRSPTHELERTQIDESRKWRYLWENECRELLAQDKICAVKNMEKSKKFEFLRTELLERDDFYVCKGSLRIEQLQIFEFFVAYFQLCHFDSDLFFPFLLKDFLSFVSFLQDTFFVDTSKIVRSQTKRISSAKSNKNMKSASEAIQEEVEAKMDYYTEMKLSVKVLKRVHSSYFSAYKKKYHNEDMQFQRKLKLFNVDEFFEDFKEQFLKIKKKKCDLDEKKQKAEINETEDDGLFSLEEEVEGEGEEKVQSEEKLEEPKKKEEEMENCESNEKSEEVEKFELGSIESLFSKSLHFLQKMKETTSVLEKVKILVNLRTQVIRDVKENIFDEVNEKVHNGKIKFSLINIDILTEVWIILFVKAEVELHLANYHYIDDWISSHFQWYSSSQVMSVINFYSGFLNFIKKNYDMKKRK